MYYTEYSPSHRPVVILVVGRSICVCARRRLRVRCLSIVHVCRAVFISAAYHLICSQISIAVISPFTMRFVCTALISHRHAVAVAAACLAARTWASWATDGSLGMAVSIRAAEAIRDTASPSACGHSILHQQFIHDKVAHLLFVGKLTGTIPKALRTGLTLAQ